MKRFSTLLVAAVLAVSTLLLCAPDVQAQCRGGSCSPAAHTSACGACCHFRPVRNTFRWLRARRRANVARIRSGRLPRVFPLLWQ